MQSNKAGDKFISEQHNSLLGQGKAPSTQDGSIMETNDDAVNSFIAQYKSAHISGEKQGNLNDNT